MNRNQKTYKKKAQPKQVVIYKQPKQDMKYADYSQSNISMTSSGSFYSVLSNLTRGDDGRNNHQGNLIYPKYLQMDYYVYSNQSYNSCRVMVFQWSDSAAPSLATLLQTISTGIATISPPNISAKSNLKVLCDHKFVIAPTAGGDTTVVGNAIHQGSCFIPEKKFKPVRYAASAVNVQDNNIYVLFLSDDTVPTYPAFYFHTRLGFTD